MAVSENNWEVIASSSDARLVPLGWVNGKVRAGSVYTVLEYVARRFSNEVEGLNIPVCWGWSYRRISGSTLWSNHASGTALDLNPSRHPQGSSGTFSASQVATIRNILAAVSPAVRWGGDYAMPRTDDMHFEIHTTAANVDAVAARISTPTQPNDWFDMATQAELSAVVSSAVKQSNALIFRRVDGAMVLVNGKGVHSLTAPEWETLRNLGYTIDHDNVAQGPFATLVSAYGGLAN
jgi:D-alanyl-D-alanine carboxypeptidase